MRGETLNGPSMMAVRNVQHIQCSASGFIVVKARVDIIVILIQSAATCIFVRRYPVHALREAYSDNMVDAKVRSYEALQRKMNSWCRFVIGGHAHVDHIVVMKDGKVGEQGTYQDLIDRKGAFAEYYIPHSEHCIHV